MKLKYVCIECHVNTKGIVCGCGCRSFVVGKYFYYRKGKVFCGCNNHSFSARTSVRQPNLYKKVYKCNSCEEIVEVHHYLDK